tara:strand:+ start:299 stop:493 length:195 start_codon:yes stop_codon:yes gene_type:complete
LEIHLQSVHLKVILEEQELIIKQDQQELKEVVVVEELEQLVEVDWLLVDQILKILLLNKQVVQV